MRKIHVDLLNLIFDSYINLFRDIVNKLLINSKSVYFKEICTLEVGGKRGPEFSPFSIFFAFGALNQIALNHKQLLGGLLPLGPVP